MNNQYISKLKRAIEDKLKIANWEPNNNQIFCIAQDIYQNNCEPTKDQLLKIIQKYYNKRIVYLSNEGLDNSDLITLLSLATQVIDNAN